MMDYSMLEKQCQRLWEQEPHPLPALANTAALLYENMEDLNWAGFYLMEGDSLMLGPFQGKMACIRIPARRGVCGKAVAENQMQLVSDVHRFEGHIACDSRSNAELVFPIHHNGRVIGVLDLDSPTPGRFTAEDADGLRLLVARLETTIAWDRWKL